MSDRNTAAGIELLQAFNDAWNRHDLEALMGFMADDCAFEASVGGGIPIMRVLLIVYMLTPLVLGARPLPHADTAFRLSEDLRPWSMAEIFIIGVAVALVKVADLAQVFIGPAFWMFAALVVVTILQDTLMCRWSLWRTLETAR